MHPTTKEVNIFRATWSSRFGFMSSAVISTPTTLPVSIASDPLLLFIFQSICIITGRLSLTPPPHVHTVAHNLEGNRKLPLLSSHISPAGPTTHRRQP